MDGLFAGGGTRGIQQELTQLKKELVGVKVAERRLREIEKKLNLNKTAQQRPEPARIVPEAGEPGKSLSAA